MVEIDQDENGFLTPKQRAYLNGEAHIDEQSVENSMRGKIRNRIETAFSEMQLLESDKIDSHERKLIIESGKEFRGNTIIDWPDSEEALTTGPIGLTGGFMSFFKFYYKTMRENGYSEKDECKTIAYILKKAEQEYLEGHQEVEVTVEIESVDSVDLESAKKRYKHDGIHGVSGVEMKALAEAGYLEESGSDE